MMNAQKKIKIGGQIFVGFSALSLGYVALLSIVNPQATMDLVKTTLPNLSLHHQAIDWLDLSNQPLVS